MCVDLAAFEVATVAHMGVGYTLQGNRVTYIKSSRINYNLCRRVKIVTVTSHNLFIVHTLEHLIGQSLTLQRPVKFTVNYDRKTALR